MSYDPEAAERVRRLLSGRDDVAEKRMVGGLSFLVNGNMCCGITGTALMVRVGAEGDVEREPAGEDGLERAGLAGDRIDRHSHDLVSHHVRAEEVAEQGHVEAVRVEWRHAEGV